MIKKKPKVISESLGVPSEIDMLVGIFSDMVKGELDKFKQSGKKLKTRLVDTRIKDDVEILSGKISIGANASWEYVKNSPKFKMEEWKKFPMFKNPVEIDFEIFNDSIFDSQSSLPIVNASHQFEPEKFKIKRSLKYGEIYNISKFSFSIMMKKSNWENIESLSPKLDASVAHEIFHSYQLYKKYLSSNKIGFGKENMYNTLANALKQDFAPDFNRFLHTLYLSLRFEHQARVPQALKILKNEKVSNYSEFISAIKKTDMWEDMMTLKNFSSDKIIDDLSKIENLRDVLTKPQQNLYINQRIIEWDEILEQILKFSKDANLSVEPIRKMNKSTLEDPKLFFKYWEKFFHRRGDELFKKLTRLYGMINN